LWRREAGEALERFIRHALAGPGGGRIIGFQVKLAAEDTVVYELLHPV
jgi:hypothetical protein